MLQIIALSTDTISATHLDDAVLFRAAERAGKYGVVGKGKKSLYCRCTSRPVLSLSPHPH